MDNKALTSEGLSEGLKVVRSKVQVPMTIRKKTHPESGKFSAKVPGTFKPPVQ